jgi:FkbM family methyltransferase
VVDALLAPHAPTTRAAAGACMSALWPFGKSETDEDGHLLYKFRGRRIVHREGFDAEILRQVCRKNEYDAVCPGIFSRQYGTLVDVGANIGAVSIGFADCFESITSFEPSAANFGLLSKSIELNGLGEKVTAHNVGIGASEEEARLFAFMTDHESKVDEEWNFGAKMTYFDDTRHNQDEYEVIKLMPQSWFEDVLPPQIDLLKIDCEGGEEHFFYTPDGSGLSALMGERVQRFVGEIHPGLNPALASDRLLPLLEQAFTLTFETPAAAQEDLYLLYGERK